jgi:hypothetical protein
MYLTTQRVFPWNVNPQVYSPSEWETASNLLTLQILPDPGWQERELARINAKPSDPAVCRALSVLYISSATAEKLEIIRRGSPCDWRYDFNQTEYSSALKGMDQIMQSPGYGVVQRDVNLFLHMKNWLAHPEFRHSPEGKDAADRFYKTDLEVFVASERDLVHELCEALPAKTPDARTTTQQTIDGLTANKFVPIPNCQPPAAARHSR